MENIKLRQLAVEFCDKHIYANEDDIYNFLVDNEWRIADNYDKTCHKEDIMFELEEREYNINAIPDKLIDSILYRFEDMLGDYGNECGWRTILNNTMDYFEEDLEEYKLEED